MKKYKIYSPPVPHLLQAQQALALLYAKVAGHPSTGSYPAPSPTGWSEFSLCARHFVGFVVLLLNYQLHQNNGRMIIQQSHFTLRQNSYISRIPSCNPMIHCWGCWLLGHMRLRTEGAWLQMIWACYYNHSCALSQFVMHYLSPIMRKPVFATCEQQRRRSACASTQSDQHLCYSLPR